MKDIPIFATEFGVASLVLREIPYKQVAFVRVQDVQPGALDDLLAECVGFCRAAGAEQVLATGGEGMETYPLDSTVLQMSLIYEPREPEAMLWPVTEKTVARWREVYNKAMADLPNHATLTSLEEKEIVTSGGAYFVHQNGELLGLGWFREEQLLALVSVVPGMGATVARTLFTAMEVDRITLEVASTNICAIRLYEKLGFLKTGERERWYKIR